MQQQPLKAQLKGRRCTQLYPESEALRPYASPDLDGITSARIVAVVSRNFSSLSTPGRYATGGLAPITHAHAAGRRRCFTMASAAGGGGAAAAADSSSGGFGSANIAPVIVGPRAPLFTAPTLAAIPAEGQLLDKAAFEKVRSAPRRALACGCVHVALRERFSHFI